jgi:hypothetical protein
MNAQRILILVIALAGALSVRAFAASGPDVIVGFVTGGREDDRNAQGQVGLTAATTSCNKGNAPLQWKALPSNQHPVISLNLYRLMDGRIEQIGKSWVKHGFLAVNSNDCAGIPGVPLSCTPGNAGDQLRSGCSDTYGAELNADPAQLGPRSKINPVTGKFDPATAKDLTGYPPSVPLDRIMLMDEAELKFPNATYFLEGHYITADDAAAGNSRNNVTYRQVKPVLQGNAWSLQNTTPDMAQLWGQPAMSAWKADGAQLAEVATKEGSGVSSYVIVGSKVTPLGNGKYRYDFAVYNMNSDLAIQSFSVPVKNLDVASVEFKGIPTHGEIWSNDPWTAKIDQDRVTWSTKTYAQDPNANALRWGTTYNFRFVAGAPGAPSKATLAWFKPPPAGVSPNVAVQVSAPAP